MTGDTLYGALPFAVSVSRRGRRLVIVARGELDLATAPAVERVLGDALADVDATGELDAVELDLGGLDFIDLAGIRAIRRCGEIARARNLRFELGALSPQAQRLVELCEALTRRN